MIFQELGVYGNFTNKDEFDMNLIPFDSDLMSLEQDKCFTVSLNRDIPVPGPWLYL